MWGLAFVWLTDWRVVVDKIPIYNGKFRDMEKEFNREKHKNTLEDVSTMHVTISEHREDRDLHT